MTSVPDSRFISLTPSSVNFGGVPHTNDVIQSSYLTQILPANDGAFSPVGVSVAQFEATTVKGDWVDFSQSFFSYDITYATGLGGGVEPLKYISEGAGSPFSRLVVRSNGTAANLEDIQEFNTAQSILESALFSDEKRYGPGSAAENLGDRLMLANPILGTNAAPAVNASRTRSLYLYPMASGILSNKKLMPLWTMGSLFIELYLDRAVNAIVAGFGVASDSTATLQIINLRYNLHIVRTNPIFTDAFQALTTSLDESGRGGVLIPYHSVVSQVSNIVPGTTLNINISVGPYRVKSALSVVRRGASKNQITQDYLKTYLFGLSSVDAIADPTVLAMPFEYYYTVGGEQYPRGVAVNINRSTTPATSAPNPARAMAYFEQALSTFGRPLSLGSLYNIFSFGSYYSFNAAAQEVPVGIPAAPNGLLSLVYPDRNLIAPTGVITATTTAFVPKFVYAMNFEKDHTSEFLSGIDVGSGNQTVRLTINVGSVVPAVGYELTTIFLVDRVISIGAAGQVFVI